MTTLKKPYNKYHRIVSLTRTYRIDGTIYQTGTNFRQQVSVWILPRQPCLALLQRPVNIYTTMRPQPLLEASQQASFPVAEITHQSRGRGVSCLASSHDSSYTGPQSRLGKTLVSLRLCFAFPGNERIYRITLSSTCRSLPDSSPITVPKRE